MADVFESIYNALSGLICGPVMLVLLIGTGMWYSFRTGFFQLRHFGSMIHNTLGRLFHAKKAGKGTLSPLTAFSMSLAGTVGTGNLVGVATAIVSGGPGAIFWMWASAFFGMMTKYAEIVLALLYRKRNAKGEWIGGPMYYIQNGLGKGQSYLAALFALFGAMAAFGIGNIAQVHSMTAAVQDSMTALDWLPFNPNNVPLIRIITGVVVLFLIRYAFVGGLSRIGRATSLLVPLMSALYIAGALFVLVVHADKLTAAFMDIFSGAFRVKAGVGGVMGYTIKQSMRYGIARGVFSNEAGIGSAPMAHACADEHNPLRQGLYGLFEVFVDTFVVCTLTALVILTSGVFPSISPSSPAMFSGAPMTIAAFEATMGGIGRLFISACILMFAFSSMLSWSFYGQRCIEYLLGENGTRVYRALFLLAIPLGAMMELNLAWDISDMLNGLMSMPNLIALLSLSGVVVKLIKAHGPGTSI